MVGQFVKEGPKLLGELFPLRREGHGREGDAGKAIGELLAGRGVGVHDKRAWLMGN